MIKLANFDIAFRNLIYADLRSEGCTILCIQIGDDYKEIKLSGDEDLAYRKFRSENDVENLGRMAQGSNSIS